MKYCSHCGVQIDEQAVFCPSCGQTQTASPTHQSNTPNRLHCPHCKGTQLSPIVETEVSGGTSLNHAVTRKSSVSAFNLKNTHRNYWMCQNCGHKFRNIDNLNEEIATQKKAQKSALYSAILFAVMCILAFGSKGMIPAIIISAIFGFFVISFKKKIDDLTQELKQLEQTCLQ